MKRCVLVMSAHIVCVFGEEERLDVSECVSACGWRSIAQRCGQVS